MSSTVPHQSASEPAAPDGTPRLSGDGIAPFPDGSARPRQIKTPRLSAERLHDGPSRGSLERLHNEAEALVQPFDFVSTRGRADLGRTNLMRGLVQTFKRGGGEPKMHYHGNTDCFWLVLKGRARFHGADDELIGEFGPQQGTIMPAYARYRFENAGDGDLEMLQVLAFHDRDRKDTGRVDL